MNSKIRLGTGIDSGNGGPLQVSWNRKTRNCLNAFMTLDLSI
ncbi:hypothetical protein D1BOALGB6SA_5924 [Olavius sp. associated proteobacterium Delta 1]|nr:hypothetical protein D1BOALGB6SA_5924 [Olavius sp. associated proteobacterium Delta 1]